MLWGPQSDLARDPRWGRSEEVYGEDPFLNGTMAVAFIKGLQGDDPKYWQAAALLKHFLANENENHRNGSSSNFDERLFWEYYSVPFRMGFRGGRREGGDGFVQRVEWHGDGRQSDSEEHCSRQVGRGRDFERRRSGEAAGRSAPSLSRSEGGGGGVPEGRHQPVPRRVQGRDQGCAEGWRDHRGGDRCAAQAEVPDHDPARAAGPAGDGSLLEDQRLARSRGIRTRIAMFRGGWRSNPWCC